MKKTCYLLGFFVFTSLFTPAYAQYSRLEIRINWFFSGATNEQTDGKIEHTWKFRYKDNAMANYAPERCHSATTDHDVTNIYRYVNDEFTARYYTGSVPEYFNFMLRGYEDDADERCEENSRDEQKENTNRDIYLSEFAPGQWSQEFTMWTNRYGVGFQLRYTPIAPTVQSVSPNVALICADATTTLTAAIAIPNTSGLTYQWQYNIQGDEVSNPDNTACQNDCWDQLNWCSQNGGGSACYTAYSSCRSSCDANYPPYIANWRDLGSNATTTYAFTPESTIFSGGISSNRNVQFRARVSGSETYSAYGSSSGYRAFSPAAPKSTATPTSTPSCPGSSTGTITLTNISSAFTTYRYILKRGDVATLGCDPEAGNCLTDVERSGANTGTTLSLTDIPVGTYSLFLLNSGGSQGICPRRIGGAINVTAIPNLQIALGTPTQIACNGANSGAISLSISNGRPNNVLYTLLNQTLNESQTTTTTTANASVSFSNLKPGNYSITASDGCTPPDVDYFTITEPVKILGVEFDSVQATCNNPGNGWMRVKVAKSSGTPVSTLFTYELFRNGQSLGTVEQTADILRWDGLIASNNYRLVVKEKTGQDCNAYERVFSLNGPAPITLSSIDIDSASCFGYNDGVISVTALGGTGSYNYALSGPASATNTTGTFTGLRAGTYTITVTNQITCSDFVSNNNLIVKQPNQLVAAIERTNITCNDKNDGRVTSDVRGGTGAYTYNWQMMAADWADLADTTPSIDRKFEGDYRLIVRDDKLCKDTSNVVTILRPDEIAIDDIVVSDIKCFGEQGTIAITPSGGTPPFTYYYSTNDGANYTGFNTSGLTPLNAATYKLMVLDSNSCPLETDNTYAITAPTAALNFTFVKSDHNGFNISCFGGNNGTAMITATGGNDAGYSGYTYTFDNAPFSTDPFLQGITAGLHTLQVQDARGCIVTKNETFTQTDAQLTPELENKEDVTCFGAPTGELEVSASGGLPPYQYSIDGTNFQDNGKFIQLVAAPYTITVRDKNNCGIDYSDNIIHRYPAIEINANITHVSCFGGKDGAVATAVSGGAPPYTLQWSGVNDTDTDISGLAMGTYTLRVKDSEQCETENAYIVGEPLRALQTTLDAIPVCYGRDNGIITIAVVGGTPPYRHSIDNGQNFQPGNIFNRGVGTYTITTEDSNGCTTSGSATIIQRNDKPEPNFVVAATRNALDTLAVTDISVPKPDSINWAFDNATIIIDDNENLPLIKFSSPGTYTVSMAAYFQKCEYIITKTITVNPFDPAVVDEKLPGYRPIENVSVTPNPSTGEFNVVVKLNKKYNLTIQVYDMLGGRHFHRTHNSVTDVDEYIDLPEASAGVYVVRVITDSDARDVRIVINK